MGEVRGRSAKGWEGVRGKDPPGASPGFQPSGEAAAAGSRGRKPMESVAFESSRVGGDSKGWLREKEVSTKRFVESGDGVKRVIHEGARRTTKGH